MKELSTNEVNAISGGLLLGGSVSEPVGLFGEMIEGALIGSCLAILGTVAIGYFFAENNN